MKSSPKRLQLTEDQALYFRTRRGFLAQEGAADAATCARNLIGTQSQVLAPGLLALSQRTAGKPTAAQLEAQLFGPRRDLVRTWGQRGTIHIYDAAETWASVIFARELWYPVGRRGPMPSAATVQAALKTALSRQVVVKKDLVDQVSAEYIEKLDDAIGDDRAKALFAAGRFIWMLSLQGQLCQGERQGSAQSYATRKAWFPDLDWPSKGLNSRQACVELTRRYLAINAPATAHDVAHHFGSKVSEARQWLEILDQAGELLRVECGGRDNLLALCCDEAELQIKPGRGRSNWPLRLLPMWDTLLMSHRDKSWTVPEENERPLVWKKAAMVSPVVLDRGRVVALWQMKRKSRRVDFELEPLAGWKEGPMAKSFVRECQAVADHLELAVGDIKC